MAITIFQLSLFYGERKIKTMYKMTKTGLVDSAGDISMTWGHYR
jgi:hypothetical protein